MPFAHDLYSLTPIQRGKATELAKDDAIIRMDADDTHSPAYIPAMLQKLEEGFHVAIS